jgi:hypothetical protein
MSPILSSIWFEILFVGGFLRSWSRISSITIETPTAAGVTSGVPIDPTIRYEAS